MRNVTRNHDTEILVPLGRPARQWPTGRVCAEDDCTSILSRYNPGPHCFLHTPDRNLATPTRKRGARRGWGYH